MFPLLKTFDEVESIAHSKWRPDGIELISKELINKINRKIDKYYDGAQEGLCSDDLRFLYKIIPRPNLGKPKIVGLLLLG